MTKRLYVQNVAEWEEMLRDGKLSDRKLGVKTIERGIILPVRRTEGKCSGGVCDQDFNFVAGYTRFNPVQKKSAWINVQGSYKVAREDIFQLDEDVIFGGMLTGHFGHFVTECWSRLWFVIQSSLNAGRGGDKVLFIIHPARGYKAWFNDYLKLMGIDLDRVIYVDKPVQCRSVTVPDQSQYWDEFTREWLLPFQAIKSNVTPANHKKLYLTRTKLENRPVHIHNEKYFEDFFAARGFEVVAPEKLKPEEQIALIMGADEIAATMGTLTHWAMFCKLTAKFIMFPRNRHYDGHFQRFINNAFANYFIVDVSKNFMYANHDLGEILIGSTKYWKEFVADYFGENISEDDDAPYLEDALDRYINFWCDKYHDPKNKKIWQDSLRDMCNRIIAAESQTDNQPTDLEEIFVVLVNSE